MATTPSGLPVLEAEKLSKEQKITLPAEGSLVRVPAGEGAERLFVRQGNTLYTIDYSSLIPTKNGKPDWQGKTIGSWMTEGNRQIFEAMGGKENIPLLNAADFYAWEARKDIQRKNLPITDILSKSTGAGTIQAPAEQALQDIRVPTPVQTSAQTKQLFTSLVDIYSSRPDLQKAFPQGTTAGTADNRKLNDWWNTSGVKEYPNTSLVQPGDARITAPMTIEEQQGKPRPVDQFTDLIEKPTGDVTGGDLGAGDFVFPEVSGSSYESVGAPTSANSELAALKQRISDAEKIVQDSMEKLANLGESSKSMSELLQEQWDSFGIGGDVEKQRTLIAEADAINQEIISMQAERDNRIMSTETIGMPNSFILGRQALIERQYNSSISAKSALLSAKMATIQALQGNISQARSFASDMINAMTYDYQREYNEIKDFISYNKDIVDDLDKDYKDILDRLSSQYESLYDQSVSDAEKKADLLVSAANRGVVLGDITNMSYDQALAEYSSKVAGKVVTKESVSDSGKKTDELILVLDGGEQIDITTVYGLQKLKEAVPDIAYSDIYARLDTKTTLSDSAIKSLLLSAGLREPGASYITKNYFIEKYSRDKLLEGAKEAGLTSFWKGEDTEINDYIDYLMENVNEHRKLGYTDDMILEIIEKE